MNSVKLNLFCFLCTFAFHAPLLAMAREECPRGTESAHALTEAERKIEVERQTEHDRRVEALMQEWIKQDRAESAPRSAFMQWICDSFRIDEIRAHWVYNAKLIKAEVGKDE